MKKMNTKNAVMQEMTKEECTKVYGGKTIAQVKVIARDGKLIIVSM